MTYIEEHAGALEDVRDAGTAVTFALDAPAGHDPLSGGFSEASTTTVSGYAIQVKGDGQSKAYTAGETISREPLTLFFVPDTYGDVPPEGSKAAWAGETRTVLSTRNVAPDGTPIAVYVELG